MLRVAPKEQMYNILTANVQAVRKFSSEIKVDMGQIEQAYRFMDNRKFAAFVQSYIDQTNEALRLRRKILDENERKHDFSGEVLDIMLKYLPLDRLRAFNARYNASYKPHKTARRVSKKPRIFRFEDGLGNDIGCISIEVNTPIVPRVSTLEEYRAYRETYSAYPTEF